MKHLAPLLFLFLLMISCKEVVVTKAPKTPTEKQVLPIKQQHIVLDIDGMSCEIGCARTIESTLSKTQGISHVQVSFDEKKGRVTFDANKISKEAIAEKILSIGNGKLYKVTNITAVNLSAN
ncbi:MAG: heavy metal-associated domain-containing protein [Lutibacter sp.]|nr:heavy metal-associated domain-containing protein [Lutibacter sp.]